MRPDLVEWLASWTSPSLAHALAPNWWTMIGLAGCVTLWALIGAARRDGVDERRVAAAVLLTFVAAVAGGLLGPALADAASAWLAHGTWRLRAAGMTSWAGFVAGLVALAWATRALAIPRGWLLDRSAPWLAVSLALARVGCFLAGCDFGRVGGGPLAVTFPRGAPAWRDHVERGFIPAGRADSLPVHPTQLYEAALGVALAVGAALWLRRRGAGTGRVFAAVAASYAAGRFAIESLRGDTGRGFVGALSHGQAFALATLAAATLVLVGRRRATSAMTAAAAALALALVVPSSTAEAQPSAAPPVEPTPAEAPPPVEPPPVDAPPPVEPAPVEAPPPIAPTPVEPPSAAPSAPPPPAVAAPAWPPPPERFAVGASFELLLSASAPVQSSPGFGLHGLWRLRADRRVVVELRHFSAEQTDARLTGVTASYGQRFRRLPRTELWAQAGVGLTSVDFPAPFTDRVAAVARVDGLGVVRLSGRFDLVIRPLTLELLAGDGLGGAKLLWSASLGVAARFGAR